MDYQLIAFDMDGTLLDSAKRVLPSSTAAIERAVAAGRHVAICTGRSPCMVELTRKDLGAVRYAICCNGTVLYDLVERRVLTTVELPHEVLAQAEAALGDQDVMIDLFQGAGYLCQPDHIERMPEFGLGIYRDMYRATATPVADARAAMLDPSLSFQKFIFHFHDAEARERMVERLRDLPAELARSEESSLEFSPLGTTKGTGLLALANLLGVAREATIAVGDADNDLPMLAAAGLAVAMGNANERVRAAADVIVADNDHGGCAEAVERFLLGGEAPDSETPGSETPRSEAPNSEGGRS